jgi:hypothetical protein
MVHKTFKLTALLAMALATCEGAMAQTISAIAGEAGRTSNRDAVRAQNVTRLKPNVVVFTGDTVIPHFIDGQFWQTAVTLVNLENHPTNLSVLFFDDNGFDLLIPVAGAGLSRGVDISLPTAGSVTFQTTGTSAALYSGWALLSQPNSDSVASFAIFRHSPPGLQPQEATVPTVSQYDDHFVLPFDNTGKLFTGIALANPTTKAVRIPVNIRNEDGRIIDTQFIPLDPYAHVAFLLSDVWGSTDGIRGTAEFVTSGYGVGALGLRFNGSAFTTLNVVSNLAWR